MKKKTLLWEKTIKFIVFFFFFFSSSFEICLDFLHTFISFYSESEPAFFNLCFFFIREFGVANNIRMRKMCRIWLECSTHIEGATDKEKKIESKIFGKNWSCVNPTKAKKNDDLPSSVSPFLCFSAPSQQWNEEISLASSRSWMRIQVNMFQSFNVDPLMAQRHVDHFYTCFPFISFRTSCYGLLKHTIIFLPFIFSRKTEQIYFFICLFFLFDKFNIVSV